MGLGAAEAIGKELGMKIVLGDISEEAIDKGVAKLAEAGVEADGFVADARNQEEAAQLVAYAAKTGTLKGLINLAGISPKGGPDYHVSYKLVFDIAVCGTVFCSQEAAKAMTEGGCIINISSTSPFLVPAGTMQEDLYPLAAEDFSGFLDKMHAALAASGDEQTARNYAYMWGRRFIIWYTEWLACQVGKQNIRVVSIGPGVVDGPMVEESGLNLARMSAIGRTGRPEELAAVYAFMLSDKASYISGTNLMVDGGIVAAIHNIKR
jgi:NAD(P)-dependent dehydrogenase (short-subunit alcohol dehydrogenase family)